VSLSRSAAMISISRAMSRDGFMPSLRTARFECRAYQLPPGWASGVGGVRAAPTPNRLAYAEVA
jgi:hypothetical protein